MKRFLLAIALTTVVAAGLPASATAAPGDNPGTSRSSVSKADRRLGAEQRKVRALIGTRDRALVRAERTVTRAGLAVGETEVLVNIAADRALLAELAAAVTTTATVADARALGTQVRAFRTEVYGVVVNGLRQAVRFQQQVEANAVAISDLGAEAGTKELEGYDVTEVRALLDSAALANNEALVLADAVIAQALLLTSTSAPEERDAFTGDLADAGAGLETVEAQLQLAADTLMTMVPAAEPVV